MTLLLPSVRRTPAWAPALALALALGSSCGSPSVDPVAQGPEAALAPDMEDEARRIADQILAGNYVAARTGLDQLLVQSHLAEARRELTSGTPEDALNRVDEALRIEPNNPEALLLKARGSLRLAEVNIARGGSAGLIEGALDDARDYWALVEPGLTAYLGACRTATMQGDAQEAVRFARLADEELAAGAERAGIEPLPERVLAEATFRAFVAARLEESDEAGALFDETQDFLSRLLGRTPDDPWAWGTLADLHEWTEDYDTSIATLERGLARAPEAVELYDRLARVARKQGGRPRALEVLGAQVEREPDLGLPRWYEALERFDDATDRVIERFAPEAEMGAAQELVSDLELAEQGFRHCRELSPELTQACLGYEIMSRNAAGWALYQSGELEAAQAAFLSMAELNERGAEWKIEGRLLSGTDGLHLVGQKYNEREDWAPAGDSYAALFELQPEEPMWANNAGFFYRDAAVELEVLGRYLCRAAHGEVDDAEILTSLREVAGIDADDPVAYARASNELMEGARALMVLSREAYLEAARLSPEDVRVVNDTALVLVYYAHSDLELAERMLLDCVELGTRQLEDETLSDDARWELENAWGDAHQNLGVLYANHRNDPESAQRWFERSVEIGPDPRPLLTDFWLPLLRGELEPSPEQELIALRTWATPCSLDER